MVEFLEILFHIMSCAAPTETALSSDEALLAETEKEYREAEAAFNQACRAVLLHRKQHPTADAVMVINDRALMRLNSMKFNPELARLCAVRARTLTLRNQLLARRANLRRELGLIR